MSNAPDEPDAGGGPVAVYIDGLNLFYGALRRTRWRWLDLGALSDALAGLPVDRIVYCTAVISSAGGRSGGPVRQQAYLKAVTSDPRVEVLRGRFLRSKVVRQLVGCEDPGSACFARIHDDEEKGSDVNLASRLLHDGHLGRYRRAILVTGDSDLVEPVRLLVKEVGLGVEVVNPRKGRSRELAGVASGYRGLDRGLLQRCQLPAAVERSGVTLVRPREWDPANEPADRSPARHRGGGCCAATGSLGFRKF